jgi:choline transport protein
MLVAVLFCADNINDTLESPTGFPFIETFNQAIGSVTAATEMTVMIVLAQVLACNGLIVTESCTTWTFACEKSIPGY